MSAQKRDWIIALSYIVLIYATLEVARFPLAYLRSLGMLRLTLGVFFFISLCVCLIIVVHHHSVSAWRLTSLGAVSLIYFLSSGKVKTPEEQVHFFEYGLVGILCLRALTHHIENPLKLWPAAFFMASAAGWCDELLQGLAPHRHYDIRDVALNALSAALGLFVYFIAQPSNSPR